MFTFNELGNIIPSLNNFYFSLFLDHQREMKYISKCFRLILNDALNKIYRIEDDRRDDQHSRNAFFLYCFQYTVIVKKFTTILLPSVFGYNHYYLA